MIKEFNNEYFDFYKLIEKLEIEDNDKRGFFELIENEPDNIVSNAINEFAKYLNEIEQFENKVDENAQSKIKHTLNVVNITKEIIKDFRLNSNDRRCALIISLLHDIGRFDQILNYKGGNIPYHAGEGHPQKGAKILFSGNEENKEIRRFIKEDGYDEIIYKAVIYHGDKELPKEITDSKELFFCNLVRDVDIVENMIHKSEYSLKDLMRNLGLKTEKELKEVENQTISKEVLSNSLSKTTVKNSDRKTKVDYLVGYLSLVYALEFDISYKYIKNSDSIDKLYKLINYNGKTKEDMEKVKGTIDKYINNKIKEIDYEK